MTQKDLTVAATEIQPGDKIVNANGDTVVVTKTRPWNDKGHHGEVVTVHGDVVGVEGRNAKVYGTYKADVTVRVTREV